MYEGKVTYGSHALGPETVIDEGEDIQDIVVARKVAYYVSFWFVGRPNTQKEFQEMIDMALKLDEESEEPPKEEKKQVKS